jgi:hypothetical protein
VFVLDGILDEESGPTLHELLAAVTGSPQAIMDTGGVRRINSLGVRAWVDFMKQLERTRVVFRRCSPAFVDQLNTVVDFRGNASVESFLAPYVCESTGNVFYEELTVGKDVRKGADFGGLTHRPCSECAEPLVFDDLPERYLHFLTFL